MEMPPLRGTAFGALAGLCATMAMTMVMRRLHEALPPDERYPLPPREITERALPVTSKHDAAATALLAHFGYGALTGALYGCVPRHRPPGIVYGPAIWAASYFGWIPAAGLLKPAHRHPARRNALMILAHAVWGATLALGLSELQTASQRGFGANGSRATTALKDAAHDSDR